MATDQAAEAPAALRRRQLLGHGFWTGIAVLSAGGLAAAADFLIPHGVQRFGSYVTVPPRNVPKPGGVPYHDASGKFWLVNLKPGEGVSESFQGRFGVGQPSQKGRTAGAL